MSVAAIGGAAVLLAVERAVYAVIARAPAAFLALCVRLAPAVRGGPIAIVARWFYAFKALQVSVFAVWCLVYGNGSLVPGREGPIVLGVAAALVVVGQILVLRFPHADWCVLPAVETVYYAAATWLESPRRAAQGLRKRTVPM